MTPSTPIRLSPEGQLQLVLPDGRGGERLLELPTDEAEGTLRRILRAQRSDTRIGTEGPATYSFLLHLARHGTRPNEHCPHCQRESASAVEGFVAKGGHITVLPTGATSSPRITADANPEDLGL